MAIIEQELTLVDKFSSVFDKYIERLEKLNKKEEEFEKLGKSNNKEGKDFSEILEKLNNSSNNLATNGLERLTRRLLMVGGAYLSFNKLKISIMDAAGELDNAVRFGNQFKSMEMGNAVMSMNRQLAVRYGEDTKDFTNATSTMTKFTTRTQDIDRMYRLAEKLAAINTGMSVSQAASSLASGINSRSGTGIAETFGLDMAETKKQQLSWLLERGRFDEAIGELEKLTEAAGGTGEAVARMLDTPLRKIKSIGTIFQQFFTQIGGQLLDGLQPAIDKLLAFLESDTFATFQANILVIANILGTVLGTAIEFLINNLNKIALVVGVVLAGFLLFKTISVLITGAKLAMAAFNVVCAANPIGLVVIAIVALVAGLTILMSKLDNSATKFSAFIGVLAGLGAYIFNIGVNIYNTVIGIINGIISLGSGMIDFIKKLFTGDLIGAFESLFKGIANAFENIWWTIIKNVAGSIKWVAGFFEDSKLGKFFKERAEAAEVIADDRLADIGTLKAADHKDVVESYEKGRDWANDIEAMLKKGADLESIMKEIEKYTGGSEKELRSINNSLDPDAWLDNFSKFVISDMEQKNNINMNIQNPVPVMNITNNFNGDTTSEDFADACAETLHARVSAN